MTSQITFFNEVKICSELNETIWHLAFIGSYQLWLLGDLCQLKAAGSETATHSTPGRGGVRGQGKVVS